MVAVADVLFYSAHMLVRVYVIVCSPSPLTEKRYGSREAAASKQAESRCVVWCVVSVMCPA